MKKNECFRCGSKDVTAYAGDREFPLCTECWKMLYEHKISVADLEEKFKKNE